MPLRLRRSLAQLVCLSCALLALWQLETSRAQPTLVTTAIEPAAPTRLVVYLVDALSRRDVETPGAMPLLSARLDTGGLHGPVRACADAITIPCILAAVTGVDRLSMFALGRNFGGDSGALAHSVLADLQRRGHRVGYYGDGLLKSTMQGLSRVVAPIAGDLATLELGVRELDEQRLDVCIMHLRSIDETAHREHGDSPRYEAVRLDVDRWLDESIARLRPTDHVLIMGDHGHTTSGRHAAGLEVDSYAAYFGPRFAQKSRHGMAMTDHAALWARIFGLQRGSVGWVDAYFRGAPGPTSNELPRLETGPGAPWWGALVCMGLALVTASGLTSRARLLSPGTRATLLAILIVAAVFGGLGALWPEARAALWAVRGKMWYFRIVVVLTGAAGLLLARLRLASLQPAERWERRYTLMVTGAVLFALPTVYGFGGVTVIEHWLLLGVLVLLGSTLRARDYRGAMCAALAGAALSSLLLVKLVNYELVHFLGWSWAERRGTGFIGGIVAILFVLAVAVSASASPRRRVLVAAAIVGVSAAACMDQVPDAAFLVPCGLALPLGLLALSTPRLTPACCALVPPALWFFYAQKPALLAPIAGVFCLWALAARITVKVNPLLRALLVAALVWLSFWTSMGCRITGIDFDFFFRFLPRDAEVTSQWLPQTLLTLAKYFLPATFGLLLLSERAPLAGGTLGLLTRTLQLRSAITLLFVAAFSVFNPLAGTFLTADVTQEAAFWVIALFWLWLVVSSAPTDWTEPETAPVDGLSAVAVSPTQGVAVGSGAAAMTSP